jgi:murein DD-endopeptidase MepM/ murein hydrolase activator NlpD
LKKIGNFVKAGEVVSIIGNSGEKSTGPHLHFEIWKNGVGMDPANFIKF